MEDAVEGNFLKIGDFGDGIEEEKSDKLQIKTVTQSYYNILLTSRLMFDTKRPALDLD